MKPIPGINNKFLSYGLVAIFLGCASSFTLADNNTETISQTPGNVTFVSGGVGDESIDRLNSMAGEFNLKLVFAMKSGEYVSNVSVLIVNAKGKTMLDTTTEGPWLLARLPAGNYQIVARFAGNSEKRQVAVGATKLRTIDFRWASE